MNKLTKALLSGAAFGAQFGVPAFAGHAPVFHVQALHAGRVVTKTGLTHRCVQPLNCLTYTLDVSTSVSASNLHKSVKLVDTFYRWRSYSSCLGDNRARNRLKIPKKKSLYGKVSPATVEYSFCTYGPTTFYGDSYKLTDPAGTGKADSFVSILYGKFHNFNGDYKGTLTLDVSVAIGTDQPAENSN